MLSVVSNKNTITNLKRKVFCQAAWIVNISLVFFFWSLILAVSISWSDNDLCGKLLWYPYWKFIWAGETPVAEWEYHGNSQKMKIKFPFHLDFETDHCFTQWLHNHLGRCPVGVLTFLKNWDSLHARLNSHHKACSYKKKKHKKIKANRELV